MKERHPAFTLNVYRRNRRAMAFYLREGLSVTGQPDEDTGETDCTMRWRRENEGCPRLSFRAKHAQLALVPLRGHPELAERGRPLVQLQMGAFRPGPTGKASDNARRRTTASRSGTPCWMKSSASWPGPA